MTHLLVHRENAVLTMTFNRVDKKNALTADMYTALAQAMEDAAGDPAIRVAIIQGDTQVFTAGNDLMDFLSRPPRATAPGEDVPPVFRFLKILHHFPKPLIAAVCGPAVGVGTTLLLHCDLIYAGDNAAFSLPFINLGLCPEAGSSDLLPALIGYPRAAEKLLLGEPFYAAEALDLGLINRVLPPGEVNAHAQAQALKLAAKPLSALMASKALMKKSQAHIAAVMEEEFKHFSQLLVGPAAREAMTAFMQKRKPDFSQC